MKDRIVWVPEDCIFENAGDCLDKFPDLGPAALLFNETYTRGLEATAESQAQVIERLREMLEQTDTCMDCVDAKLKGYTMCGECSVE